MITVSDASRIDGSFKNRPEQKGKEKTGDRYVC